MLKHGCFASYSGQLINVKKLKMTKDKLRQTKLEKIFRLTKAVFVFYTENNKLL